MSITCTYVFVLYVQDVKMLHSCHQTQCSPVKHLHSYSRNPSRYNCPQNAWQYWDQPTTKRTKRNIFSAKDTKFASQLWCNFDVNMYIHVVAANTRCKRRVLHQWNAGVGLRSRLWSITCICMLLTCTLWVGYVITDFRSSDIHFNLWKKGCSHCNPWVAFRSSANTLPS